MVVIFFNLFSFAINYVCFVIRSFITTLVGPFPWQVSLVKYAMLFADTAFVCGVVVLSLIGILKSERSTLYRLVPIVAVLGMILLGIVIGTDNIGGMIRQRIPAVVVMAIVAIIGVDLVIKKYAIQRK